MDRSQNRPTYVLAPITPRNNWSTKRQRLYINIEFLNAEKAEADREEYKFRMILDNDDFDYSISPPVIQVRVITTLERIFDCKLTSEVQ